MIDLTSQRKTSRLRPGGFEMLWKKRGHGAMQVGNLNPTCQFLAAFTQHYRRSTLLRRSPEHCTRPRNSNHSLSPHVWIGKWKENQPRSAKGSGSSVQQAVCVDCTARLLQAAKLMVFTKWLMKLSSRRACTGWIVSVVWALYKYQILGTGSWHVHRKAIAKALGQGNTISW